MVVGRQDKTSRARQNKGERNENAIKGLDEEKSMYSHSSAAHTTMYDIFIMVREKEKGLRLAGFFRQIFSLCVHYTVYTLT